MQDLIEAEFDELVFESVEEPQGELEELFPAFGHEPEPELADQIALEGVLEESWQ
mgnify:CR=1 FL=1